MSLFILNYLHWIIIGVTSVVTYLVWDKSVGIKVVVLLAGVTALLFNQAMIHQYTNSKPDRYIRSVQTEVDKVELKDLALKPKMTSDERESRLDSIIDFRTQVNEILKNNQEELNNDK